MNVIAAVDRNWAIGFKNKLLTRIPNDLKNFRQMTIHKVVVMGRKTLESFPGGQPLELRTNIVLTTDPNYKAKGCVILHSIDELEVELQKYNSEDVYIIGGGSIYEQLLPKCNIAYITEINHAFQADTYFPNLSKMKEWEKVEISEEYTCHDLEYFFTKYIRKSRESI